MAEQDLQPKVDQQQQQPDAVVNAEEGKVPLYSL